MRLNSTSRTTISPNWTLSTDRLWSRAIHRVGLCELALEAADSPSSRAQADARETPRAGRRPVALNGETHWRENRRRETNGGKQLRGASNSIVGSLPIRARGSRSKA